VVVTLPTVTLVVTGLVPASKEPVE